MHWCDAQGLVRRFVDKKDLWMEAVNAVAELDALISLATAAMHADGEVCRPTFVPAGDSPVPVFAAKQLRHPAAAGRDGGAFVPNDVQLGGAGSAPFLVLTGPNMGGKSTMLRQVRVQ